MTAGEQLITFKRTELETLIGAGPLAFQAYVLLRWWMDYAHCSQLRKKVLSESMHTTSTNRVDTSPLRSPFTMCSGTSRWMKRRTFYRP